MDSGTHARATGRTNERILENARRLCHACAHIAVRVPVVPGFNDTGENMEQAAELLSAFRRLVSVELLPCHALGAEKLAALGREAGPRAAPRLGRIAELAEPFRRHGLPVRAVHGGIDG